MDETCADVIEQLLANLRSGFEATPAPGGCLLVAPFTRPDSEAIEIDVKMFEDGSVRLSDVGESLDYLFVNGLEVFSNKSLSQHFNRITRRHHVDFVEGELTVTTPVGQTGEALGRLLAAVQEMSYLVFRRAERAITTFADEVEKLLITGSVNYDRDHRILGATKEHHVAFRVARDSAESLIDPVTATSVSSAQAKAERLAFKWGDIKRVHPNVRGFAVLDDRNERAASVWSGPPLLALQTHSDGFFYWSTGRDRLLEQIAHQGSNLA